MKVIILAGGFGTRLSEYTNLMPKPMVSIGNRPILWHIMNRYADFGHKDFYLALGYKSEMIKDYFLNYKSLNSDFKIDLSSDKITLFNSNPKDWSVSLIDTGEKSMTGGRIKRMKPFIGNEPFLLTYGDGISDINIDKLLTFHKEQGKMVTLTAVKPAGRFGNLKIEEDIVSTFHEKPDEGEGWINGGFFVVEPKFFDLIDGDSTVMEQFPLEEASRLGELAAYKHDSFWQCMDTKRDRDLLEDLWIEGNAPWTLK
jgi:glucose-1-phosphate cytidylyltransferase